MTQRAPLAEKNEAFRRLRCLTNDVVAERFGLLTITRLLGDFRHENLSTGRFVVPGEFVRPTAQTELLKMFFYVGLKLRFARRPEQPSSGPSQLVAEAGPRVVKFCGVRNRIGVFASIFVGESVQLSSVLQESRGVTRVRRTENDRGCGEGSGRFTDELRTGILRGDFPGRSSSSPVFRSRPRGVIVVSVADLSVEFAFFHVGLKKLDDFSFDRISKFYFEKKIRRPTNRLANVIQLARLNVGVLVIDRAPS